MELDIFLFSKKNEKCSNCSEMVKKKSLCKVWTNNFGFTFFFFPYRYQPNLENYLRTVKLPYLTENRILSNFDFYG